MNPLGCLNKLELLNFNENKKFRSIKNSIVHQVLHFQNQTKNFNAKLFNSTLKTALK